MFRQSFIQLTVCLFALLISANTVYADNPSSAVVTPPWMQSIAENPAGSYRQTVNGWVDTSHWRVDRDEGKVRFIKNIHPVIWMLIVVLMASGLAVLASDEESVMELWKRNDGF